MVTANPGRFAGHKGTLRIGSPADLIRFQWEPRACTLAIEDTLVSGDNWR